MVNTKPLYYQGTRPGRLPKKLEELRKRQAASNKPQAASTKPEDLHAQNTQSFKAFEPTRSSTKQQAASPEQQAASAKPRD
tara:strand:+ start:269 stop:511 length:243 start_codon:yes stop_codon:yes gene_type:complete